MLRVEQISVTYPGGVEALKKVSYTFMPGKIYGIVGPSGSGKSSFIKAILDLAPHTGSIEYKGKTVKQEAQHIAYVEQKEAIDKDFPMTVFQFVLLGTYPKLGLFKRPKEREKQLVLEVLEEVNMLEYRDRQIGELSGGQFQRILIARALAQEADLFFLDEPFVGIDMKNESELIAYLKLLAEKGKCVIIIHHDLGKVTGYFDELLMINKYLIAGGPVEEVFNAENIEKTYEVFLPVLNKEKELNPVNL